MKPKMLTRNGAKVAELRRVATELERQAMKKLEKAPSGDSEPGQPRLHRVLTPVDGRHPEMPADLWDSLSSLVRDNDRDRVLGWMLRHMTDIPTANPRALAKERLACFIDPTHPHNTTALARIRYLVRWFPSESPPKGVAPVAAEPMQIPVNEPDSGVFEAESYVPCGSPRVDLIMTGAHHPNTVQFNGRQIRVTLNEAGEPWFIAKDLVEAVGATWNGTALTHIPAEYRGMLSISTPSSPQQMTCLSEAGMNFYLIRSDKPAALPLQKKIASEVLPELRKHGSYAVPGAAQQLSTASNDERLVGLMTSAMSAVVAPMMQLMATVTSALTGSASPAGASLTRIHSAFVEPSEIVPLGDYPTPSEQVPERSLRSLVSDLVVCGSGWQPRMTKEQSDDLLGAAWSRLYREFKARYQVDIKRRARNASEQIGKRLEYLDWVESQEDGKELMQKLYALAYTLFPPKK